MPGMDDRGEGGVLAEVLILAIGVVAALAFFMFYTEGAEPEPPTAIGLLAAPIASSQTRALDVASVGRALEWSDVEPRLDGEPLRYDADLDGARTWCVATNGTACDAALGNKHVRAGNVLYVHDVEVGGRTLTLAQADANLLLLSLTLAE